MLHVHEPVLVQALIAQLAVEGFVGAILPGASGIDVRRADVRLLEPVEDRMTDELGTVVRSQEGGRTMKRNQLGQYVDDTSGSDAACYIDRQGVNGTVIFPSRGNLNFPTRL